MASRFNPLKADAHWQKVWEEGGTFRASDDERPAQSLCAGDVPLSFGAHPCRPWPQLCDGRRPRPLQADERLLDSGKLSANAVQLQTLSAEKQSLEQTIPELQTQIDALNAKTTLSPEDTSNRDSLNKQVQDRRARLALIKPQLEQLEVSADAAVSKGFIRDILRDASGYSFHRFQIFAWTLVLGIIFVSSVYNHLTMPEFSATLLGLMGLSSGTYIGFKFPEKHK